MPIQYEWRRLVYLMNIQTLQNLTPKALILGAFSTVDYAVKTLDCLGFFFLCATAKVKVPVYP